MKIAGLDATSNAADTRRRHKNATPPMSTKTRLKKLIKGRAGMPTGLMQVLWNRVCIDPNFNKLPTDVEARKIALNTPEFKNELSQTELGMKILAIDVVFTPKGHYEVAGLGTKCSRACLRCFF